MELTRRVVIVLLCLLFAAAVAARVSTTDRLDSPYFKGTSAMAYRHALAVADGASLTAHDEKAGGPGGYTPARYRAAGAETMTGMAYRAFRGVSDVDGRPFTRRLSLLVASLCVFTAYGVASRLWNSRGAGLLAAFLVAFGPALAQATNGRVFSHVIFAAFFASLYATVALHALMTSSRAVSVGAALAAAPFLWVWEPARYALAAWVVAGALVPNVGRRTRIWFVLSHAPVIVAGAALMPHLAATRALGAWTTAAVISAALVSVWPESRRGGPRAAVWLACGTALLTALAAPLRAGATEQFPVTEYVFTRLRYLFGRPDPSALSDWMRHLWSIEHAPLAPERAIELLLPPLLCALAWLANRAARAGRARRATTLALFMVASTAAVLDRSILPGAAVVMSVMVAGAAVQLDWKRWKQSAWLALGLYTALSGVVLAGTELDVSHQLARAARVDGKDPSSFVWVSFENTDRELVRFVATRTSVQETILAPEDVSALLLAFTGRTIAQLPGTTSRAPSLRHVELTRALYRDEAALYELCRRDGIDYVVYSIDVLLDAGPYAPSRLAAANALDPGSIAARMHFAPESLRHFTLVYQNDHYRLFHVTETAEPVFLTDHPLFFQPGLFARDGNDFARFRDHVVWLTVAYATAQNARARGDAEEARRALDQCVRHAPRFTRARLALADALMDLGRYEAARDQIARVMEYAPDNPAALYGAAFVRLQMGDREGAKPFLALIAQTGDRAMIEKARALQYYVDHDIPLKPGAPR